MRCCPVVWLRKQQEADAVASNWYFPGCLLLDSVCSSSSFVCNIISLFTDIPTVIDTGETQLCNCCFGCLLRCIFAVHSRTSDEQPATPSIT